MTIPGLLRGVVLGLVVGISAQAVAQKEAPAIHVNVDLVSVAVRVTDKHGRDVAGLKASDFSITEDGQKQQIAFFDTENQPISLSILVDSSSSMYAGAKMDETRNLLEKVVSGSRMEDEISLLQFTDRVVSFEKLTKQQRLLPFGPTLSSASGGTALYDAIASALCRLHGSKNLRQAVVVITDGADQHSRLRLEDLIPMVQASRAQLFMIGFYTPPEYQVYSQGDRTVTLVTGHEIDNPLAVFERLAKESGAESFFPTTKKQLEQALDTVLSTLQSQYTIAYYPTEKKSDVHGVKVKVQHPGVRIRAREALRSAGEETAQLEGENCEVTAKLHPYPYELKLKKAGDVYDYREDFSDPRSGWPNRAGSRYIQKGYELAYPSEPTKRDGQLLINPGPIGRGVLAAYGPWWSDLRASVEVDAGWAKMHRPVPNLKARRDKEMEELYSSSAGLVFRADDAGYYAFLISTSSKAYESDELAFRLVKKTYSGVSETELVPWTRVSNLQVKQRFTEGTKLSAECIGDHIKLFIDDQQVFEVRDDTHSSGYVGLVSFGTGRVLFRSLEVEGTF